MKKKNKYLEAGKEKNKNFLLKESKKTDMFFRKNKILSISDYNICAYEQIKNGKLSLDGYNSMQMCITFDGGRFEQTVLCALNKLKSNHMKLGPDSKRIKNNINEFFEVKTERESSYHKLLGTCNFSDCQNNEEYKRGLYIKYRRNWYLIYGGFTKEKKLICCYYFKINKAFIDFLCSKIKNSKTTKIACVNYKKICKAYLVYKDDEYKKYCSKLMANFLDSLEYKFI